MTDDKPDTRPVVERPDSVTHWTCPDAPDDGMTHHMGHNGTCRYCHVDRATLAARQARLLGK